ncbi:methylenetetrahydrofolate reductase [Bacteroidia bacterium]|nr:methylenetetrahydrofolate reductase [Bacteroidia bacterium]
MKVTDILKSSENTKFTFEIVPPMKGATLKEVSSIIDTLLPYSPSYINITSHQAETILEERQDGSFIKKTVSKKPGIVGVAASIKFKYNIEVVPHLICGGFNIEETEDALFDFQFLGIQNVFALRGDAPHGQRVFLPEKNGHTNASDLVSQIKSMNKGEYYSPGIKDDVVSDFCVGVAGYPEKHTEAPNMETDIKNLKKKIDAGAEYIVTQMFFDNKKYFDFVNMCRKADINVPIIPGIKPVSILANLNNLSQIFHIDLPTELSKEIEKCKTNADVAEVGVQWTIEQCKELRKANVPALHFFTLGSTAKNIARILKATI